MLGVAEGYALSRNQLEFARIALGATLGLAYFPSPRPSAADYRLTSLKDNRVVSENPRTSSRADFLLGGREGGTARRRRIAVKWRKPGHFLWQRAVAPRMTDDEWFR
jgi:hypothetical protein